MSMKKYSAFGTAFLRRSPVVSLGVYPLACFCGAVFQVMDPRTRMILFKLLNQGFFQQIDGCLSTGKEANVYYAVGGEVRIIQVG